MSAAESEIVNAPLAEESTVGAVDSNAAAGVGSTLSPSASAAAGAAGEGGRTGADGRKLISVKVNNIPYETTKEELTGIFSKYGAIGDVHIPRNRASGRPNGYAFVRYTEESSADAAAAGENNTQLNGRVITVSKAQYERDDRPRPAAGGRPGGRDDGPRGGFPRDRPAYDSREREREYRPRYDEYPDSGRYRYDDRPPARAGGGAYYPPARGGYDMGPGYGEMPPRYHDDRGMPDRGADRYRGGGGGGGGGGYDRYEEQHYRGPPPADRMGDRFDYDRGSRFDARAMPPPPAGGAYDRYPPQAAPQGGAPGVYGGRDEYPRYMNH